MQGLGCAVSCVLSCRSPRPSRAASKPWLHGTSSCCGLGVVRAVLSLSPGACVRVQECNLAGKPIYVTRVVDTMTDAPRPTRAEATGEQMMLLLMKGHGLGLTSCSITSRKQQHQQQSHILLLQLAHSCALLQPYPSHNS